MSARIWRISSSHCMRPEIRYIYCFILLAYQESCSRCDLYRCWRHAILLVLKRWRRRIHVREDLISHFMRPGIRYIYCFILLAYQESCSRCDLYRCWRHAILLASLATVTASFGVAGDVSQATPHSIPVVQATASLAPVTASFVGEPGVQATPVVMPASEPVHCATTNESPESRKHRRAGIAMRAFLGFDFDSWRKYWPIIVVWWPFWRHWNTLTGHRWWPPVGGSGGDLRWWPPVETGV